MEGRIYITIPVSKAKEYIKVDYQSGRFSADGKFLVWDQEWDARVLDRMKKDPEVKLFTHGEALAEMKKKSWVPEEKYLTGLDKDVV